MKLQSPEVVNSADTTARLVQSIANTTVDREVTCAASITFLVTNCGLSTEQAKALLGL